MDTTVTITLTGFASYIPALLPIITILLAWQFKKYYINPKKRQYETFPECDARTEIKFNYLYKGGIMVGVSWASLIYLLVWFVLIYNGVTYK